MSRRGRGFKQFTSGPDPSWSNWQIPIILHTSPHRKEIVANPAEALAFLANRWPGEKEETYDAARRACSESLRRRVSPADARDCFERFAQTAGLLE